MRHESGVHDPNLKIRLKAPRKPNDSPSKYTYIGDDWVQSMIQILSSSEVDKIAALMKGCGLCRELSS